MTAMGDRRFYGVLRELANLHKRKSADYGKHKDPFANVRAASEFGIPPWLGSILRANDKMSRLKTFALTGSLANEGVEDSLIDLANYAIIALVLLRQQNSETQSCAS
jgi:hypothetical protein